MAYVLEERFLNHFVPVGLPVSTADLGTGQGELVCVSHREGGGRGVLSSSRVGVGTESAAISMPAYRYALETGEEWWL